VLDNTLVTEVIVLTPVVVPAVFNSVVLETESELSVTLLDIPIVAFVIAIFLFIMR
jgi:hypothetical protein